MTFGTIKYGFDKYIIQNYYDDDFIMIGCTRLGIPEVKKLLRVCKKRKDAKHRTFRFCNSCYKSSGYTAAFKCTLSQTIVIPNKITLSKIESWVKKQEGK